MSRSTPFIPFWPHVKRTQTQRDRLYGVIRRLPLETWPAKAPRVSPEAQRAVLSVVGEHSDGAGRTCLTVETISRESGYVQKTVERACRALAANGNLEITPLRRLPKNYSAALHRLARQGQGPNLYRIGPALRFRAGLREVDWSPDLDLALPMSPPTEDAMSPPTEASAMSPPDVAPSDRMKGPDLRRRHDSSVSPLEPRTREHANGEERLILSGREGTSARAFTRDGPLNPEDWPELADELDAAGHIDEADLVRALMEEFSPEKEDRARFVRERGPA